MVFVGFLALDGEQPKTIRRLLAIFMKTEAVEHHQYIFQRLLRYWRYQIFAGSATVTNLMVISYLGHVMTLNSDESCTIEF